MYDERSNDYNYQQNSSNYYFFIYLRDEKGFY